MFDGLTKCQFDRVKKIWKKIVKACGISEPEIHIFNLHLVFVNASTEKGVKSFTIVDMFEFVILWT